MVLGLGGGGWDGREGDWLWCRNVNREFDGWMKDFYGRVLLTGRIVFKKPLGLFSKEPTTGFYRDGYCRTGPEDGGNHAVAGESAHYPIRQLAS